MQVIINNYQSIKHEELTFDEGGKIIFIAGDSNKGKSAIIRSIIAVLTNQQGRDFIRHGASECSVSIDGVQWKKTKDPHYVIGTDIYNRLGSSVPPEVYALLEMYPVELEGDTIFLNIKEQDEPQFLLTTTPSKIAKLFGSFSSIDLIYSAIQQCNKDVRNNAQKLNYLDTRVKEIEEKLQQFIDTSYIYDLLSYYKILKEYNEILKEEIIDIPHLSFEPEEYEILRDYAMNKSFLGDDIEVYDFHTEHIDLLRSYLLLKSYSVEDSDSLVCPHCGMVIDTTNGE